MNRLIVGVGTGRCGTMTLARLLSLQPVTDCTHERYQSRPRANGPRHLWPLRLWRDTLREEPAIVGDVALQWTWHCRDFLRWADEQGRDVRIVGLRRDRADTVASYLSWVGAKNHWQLHDGQEWDYDPWDHCYPVYPGATSRSEAIGLYWDAVYDHLSGIEDERVRVFKTATFNRDDGVGAILDFVGIGADRTVRSGIQTNQGA